MNGYDTRVEHCRNCILTKGCTRKTIYAVDGYCWAEELEKKDPELTKYILAVRHGLIEVDNPTEEIE